MEARWRRGGGGGYGIGYGKRGMIFLKGFGWREVGPLYRRWEGSRKVEGGGYRIDK